MLGKLTLLHLDVLNAIVIDLGDFEKPKLVQSISEMAWLVEWSYSIMVSSYCQ